MVRGSRAVIACALRYASDVGTYRALSSLRDTERMTAEDLNRLRVAKLVRLLTHCEARVPYYRTLLKALSLNPRGIRSAEDLQQLPMLSKGIVREHASELRADGAYARVLTVQETGGSTGEPLRFMRDRESRIWSEACRLRAKGWAGVKPGDREVTVGFLQSPSLLGALRSSLTESYGVGVGQDEESNVRALRALAGLRPRLLEGYASVLSRLGRFLERRQGRRCKIARVCSTGETLYAFQRKTIQAAFGARVYDCYGSSEVRGLAYECEAGTMHVSDEHVILEIVDEMGRPVWERVGKVVVTDLDNYGMPLIRYVNGDLGVATKKACGCGRQLRCLEKIEGRTVDVLCLDGREQVLPKELPEAIGFVEGVKEYQIRQTGPATISVWYRLEDESCDSGGEAIREIVQRHVGARVSVTLERREDLQPSSIGKSRMVVGLG